MAIEIREIKPVKRELLKFVHFPIDTLYKDNPYYVPSLVLDEVDTLLPERNPAFDFCRSVYFMAFDDGKPVGRIAGIINDTVKSRAGHDADCGAARLYRYGSRGASCRGF